MSCRALRSLALLTAGFVTAACQGSSLTTSTQADLGIETALADASVGAAARGELDRADVLSHAAAAFRWGIRPSQIEVRIGGETTRYLAIVVGVLKVRNGEEVLVRSLVAWTGRPPTALLEVNSASDHALFGNGGGNGNGNGPGAARGFWKDILNHELWVATTGSAKLELAGTGEPCPVQPTATDLRCTRASYDMRVVGGFRLLVNGVPDGTPFELITEADGVHGVVIGPAE
jgi:hypothetical protein